MSWGARQDGPTLPLCLSDSHILGCAAGPLSRAGEGQGEGCAFSGKTWSLTPTLSRTGEGARGGFRKPMCETSLLNESEGQTHARLPPPSAGEGGPRRGSGEGSNGAG
ncbi:hypothetical protein FV228_15515 [Methylobacterium sp. WL18]|nr:hypothetical protein FV228_15515 [Methylobacterium sp. WL18]